jgi:hypothetical protein
MSSNGALIPIHHADMDESAALRGNDDPFSAERTNFLQYSLGSDETFMSDGYMEVSARAPLLSSHTMDGFSNYSGQEYEATVHARAPLLASHTMDGSSSYQPVGHFEASAHVRIPSHAVDRRQSNINEEITALYGQTLVPGSYG